jgi:hypothetical protein
MARHKQPHDDLHITEQVMDLPLWRATVDHDEKPSCTAAYCVPPQTPATTIANTTVICPRITRATSAQVVPRRSRSTFPPRWA